MTIELNIAAVIAFVGAGLVTGNIYWLKRIFSKFDQVAEEVNDHSQLIALIRQDQTRDRQDFLSLKLLVDDMRGYLAKTKDGFKPRGERDD